MTQDSRRFLQPEAISRISRLELRARHIVEGFLSGMHRSPYFGQSVEFRQHREYTVGDDIRHLDWKAYLRLNRLILKLFEEEEDLPIYIFVDSSQSMNYGQPTKLDYARRMIAALPLSDVDYLRSSRKCSKLLRVKNGSASREALCHWMTIVP